MQFELDITKHMRSGGDEFVLRSHFTTTDRALVLFGPSGSGKTLTLKAVAGLLTPDEGYIRVNGDVLYDSSAGVNTPTRRRRVGYVFQDYALFPHHTVRENVAFGLKPFFGKVNREEARSVDELIELFGLSRVAHLKPGFISGGQQQRTALARTLATKPRILLLDEPFSALDQPLRLRMRTELAKILENFDIPMIMVTHDSDEVESFAEAVVVYRDGNVVGIHSAEAVAQSGRSLGETIREEVALAYQTQ
ncbi:ABC transporter ATP-binding protein [Oceanidesulfovibrio marinus]|uniref:ABC transporter ATP-binding protein n=1 Tax=Oceanidesulfovibrio marinus TaxID=370038 RepID=A0A6P1ZG60_9BACT|nr:ATP-binding cassette domain-containing protein [Oceanidesulfovibrio marinus]QJT09581.1 ATP-binding cassette domain-containing protein [Oceanidesulfovibrio marinus]TVM33792.1 ABC transporter ATP-binding protein [Oceanidesulfovibrio marinus]